MQINLGYTADQGGPLDWAEDAQIATKNIELHSLTAVNKGAACWIQLFDLPFDPLAERAVTAIAVGIATLANHGFQIGDQATVEGGDDSETGYVKPISNDTFSLHASEAAAIAGTAAISLAGVGADPTVLLGGTPIPQAFPLPATPDGVLSLTYGRFGRGLFVRAVTAADGATGIGADDIKYTARYMVGPTT